jgi:thiol-disulfide isomerase/thioredoxin
LTAYLGKQPVVLEFWATWCDNCKKLDPTMRAAHTSFGKSVQFITVAVSVNQTAERVKAYQQRYALPGVVLYDRKGVVSGAYDAPATSYVVVIDKRGTVIYTGLGGTQNLDAAIRKAL